MHDQQKLFIYFQPKRSFWQGLFKGLQGNSSIAVSTAGDFVTCCSCFPLLVICRSKTQLSNTCSCFQADWNQIWWKTLHSCAKSQNVRHESNLLPQYPLHPGSTGETGKSRSKQSWPGWTCFPLQFIPCKHHCTTCARWNCNSLEAHSDELEPSGLLLSVCSFRRHLGQPSLKDLFLQLDSLLH